MGYFEFSCENCGSDDPKTNNFKKNKAFVKKFYIKNQFCDGNTICECNKDKYISIYDKSRIKECLLYKTLQQFNDLDNTRFHCLSWDFIGNFNESISWKGYGKYPISVYIVFCEDCYNRLKIDDTYNHNLECSDCRQNIKTQFAYSSEYYLKYDNTNEEQDCNGYSKCSCKLNDKCKLNSINECKLYKFLQTINNNTNDNYTLMNFCSPQYFYECINDDYKIYSNNIICKKCYEEL
jgi:hypothetical protein